MSSLISRAFNKLFSFLPKEEPQKSAQKLFLLGVISYLSYQTSLKMFSIVSNLIREKRCEYRRSRQKPDVIYFFMFPKASSTSSSSLGEHFSLSAPVMFLENYLRLKKIPFEEIIVLDPESISDTGRLPVIEFNGKQYQDSRFIVEFLEDHFSKLKEKEPEKYAWFVPETIFKHPDSDFVTVISIQRTIESLRLGLGRATFVDSPNKMIKRVLEEFDFPKLITKYALLSRRPGVIDMYNAHGYGDYSQEQYQTIFLEDVKAIEFYLSKKKFAFSKTKPKIIDCLIFAWLRLGRFYGKTDIGKECPAIALMNNSPVLSEYCKNMRKIVFSSGNNNSSSSVVVTAAAAAAASTSVSSSSVENSREVENKKEEKKKKLKKDTEKNVSDLDFKRRAFLASEDSLYCFEQ